MYQYVSMDIMMYPKLQEVTEIGILSDMATKKDDKKRYRIPLELPEEEKPLWHKARVAALERKMTIGRFVIESLRKELDRLAREDRKK